MTTFAIDTGSYRSPNYNERGQLIRAILLHSGEGTRAGDLYTLCNDRVPMNNRVSSHYYVCRDGTIYQLVPDSKRAWHAGPGTYQNISDWNSASIGIETEHRDGQDWPNVQREALAWLCKHLIDQYHIPQVNIAAHRWVAPGRKFDPTNWTDGDLRRWIAALYTPEPTPPDRWPLWGTVVALREDMKDWSICQLWYQNAPWLGSVRSLDYATDKSGDCTLWCQGGAVVYFAKTNRAWLQRP